METTVNHNLAQSEALPGPAWRNRIVAHGFEDAERLLANPRNWRTHPKAQQEALSGVLTEVGWVQDVIVNRRSGYLIDGHLRVHIAAKRHEKVPVVYVDLTESEEKLILVTLDPLSAMAGTDNDLFGGLLGEISVDDAGLKAMLDEMAASAGVLQGGKPGLTDDDEAPAVPDQPITQPGDLWLLGPHRVLCADSTDADAVLRLTAGEKANLAFTDPPYNVGYKGYTADKLTIEGDRQEAAEFTRFLDTVFANYRRVVDPSASMYVCHASSWQREFQMSLEAAGFEVRCQIIWAKNTFAWGHGRYKFQHEPLFYTHVKGQSDRWFGDKSQSTLWQENKPSANRLHPTMKPVELILRAVFNSSQENDVVLDLFGGSGSTLIACEKTGRRGYLMELDPRYADVIIRRWQEFTGMQAALEDDGRSFDEIAAERHKAQVEK